MLCKKRASDSLSFAGECWNVAIHQSVAFFGCVTLVAHLFYWRKIMIGSVNSPFFTAKIGKDSIIHQHLSDGEKIIKSYKNLNIYAVFTNKRIIFTYAEKPPGETAIEFVPYRSIVRLDYLSSEKLCTHNVEIYFPDCITLQFTFTSQLEAANLIKLAEKYK